MPSFSSLKSRAKPMKKRLRKLRTEMEARSEEHKDIKEGQRQVKEKIEAIETECEELKRETRFIIQQSARTQVKLTLMFQILKARETGELDTAANLTQLLREIVGREEERPRINHLSSAAPSQLFNK